MRRILLAMLAIFTLGCPSSTSPQNTKEIDELERHLHDPEPAIQARAAKDLGKFGPAAAKAVPALTNALTSSDLLLKQNAALTLGKIGPAAKRAVGPLRNALKDIDAKVRENAVFALGEIGDHAALADVEAMRADGISAVKRAAIEATEKLKH